MTYDWDKYTSSYYLKGALAGGVCCSVTHGAVCPIDVVKTRVQLDPVKYNAGLIGGFRTVVAEEGVMALATGLQPTVVGYFIQGWFKFGGFELFKVRLAKSMDEQTSWNNRTAIYLGASAGAECIADAFLCPLEAARIRQVSDPKFAPGLLPAVKKLIELEGVSKGLYSGIVPLLFKQVPYTMAKFAVQGRAAESLYGMIGQPSEISRGQNMGVSILSGVIAGVSAAIISHPADTLLSKINKKGAGGEGSMFTRLGRIAAEQGPKNLLLVGLAPRCVMIGTLTAGQFLIFDSMLPLMGVSKFHFHEPKKH